MPPPLRILCHEGITHYRIFCLLLHKQTGDLFMSSQILRITSPLLTFCACLFSWSRLRTHQHILLPDDPEKVPKWLYLDLEFVRSGSKVTRHAPFMLFISRST